MATTTTMSGAAYDQLSLEEGRYLELLHGEVIQVSRPTPQHQIIVGVFIVSFNQHFRREPGGAALLDCEFALGQDTRLCPDVAVLLSERWASINPRRSPIPLSPDIAVEVLSPSESSTDSQRKVWTYLDAGVHEVWQVIPEVQKILIYRETRLLTVLEIDNRLSTPLLPNWELSLREIFSA